MKVAFFVALSAAVALGAGTALAEPVTYTIDPGHTYPSFEADHMGGLSILRGKFNSSSGTIVYDRAAKTGTVEVTIDASSIDFGHDKLNDHARGPDMFDVEKFPTATFKGKLTSFNGETPGAVEGELTLKGTTRPVTLTIHQFLCKPHPFTQKEVCGADASTTINRDEFGIDYGKQMGFRQEVTLRIQVEAQRAS